METETLSNYNVQDKHLLEDNSAESDELLIQNDKVLQENSVNRVNPEKDHEDCTKTLKDIGKPILSDESDNDIDEEEHIPLNINEVNSDSEKSDDDLDDSDLLREDMLERNEHENDPLDTEEGSNKDISKCSNREELETGVKSQEDKQKDDFKDKLNDVDLKNDEQQNDCELKNDHEKQDDVELKNDHEEENNIKLQNDHEEENNIKLQNDHEKQNDVELKHDAKEDIKLDDIEMNLVKSPSLKEATESVDKTNNDVSFASSAQNKEDDKAETKQIEDESGENLKTDSKNEQLEDKMDKDPLSIETDPLSIDIDNPKEAEENKGENSNDGEGKEIKDSNKSKESDKNEISEQKIEDNKEEGGNRKEDEKDTSVMVDEEKKDNSEETVETSLLKETLTRDRNDEGTKDNEADLDIDMDEDFDPSLLCPDINMEIDEAPVITSSDAPPPPRETKDGDKSPLMLYEPVFSMYVDEMTGAEIHFDLSPDEENLRLQSFGENNPVQFTKIHCTACNVHLGSALDGQGNRFVHPLLKVLICKSCYHFYTSGEFERDEDGSELYCRWCGQGGQVMCCSGCEMVFCKKCIRINFDRRKLAEIRDSADWYCFRCNPSQITFQRIHCAEFMEYVRRETQRASTLENPIAYMNVDYTQCCTPQKKKPAQEPAANEPKKKKIRSTPVVDPDYDPSKDRNSESPQPSTSGYRPPASTTPSTPGNLVPIAPKPLDPSKSGGMVQVNQNSAFKIGSTTFKTKTTPIGSRPRVQVVGPNVQGVRNPTPSPGYIKILPGGIRVPGNAPRTQTFTPRQRTPLQNSRPSVPTPMKHEWFEKTVRAAARVNSNLSYTLTQLNRAQANATSVESLAVVHNKLQEILSTSINSLIQIRKNLRTEFISGIKNIRFPPKSQTPTSSGTASIITLPMSTTCTPQDDDVIFISPTVSPVPTPMQAASTSSSKPSISVTPSISLIRKTTPPSTSTTSTPTTSQNGTGVPRSFLRVKPLTALQSVPSECITIPDDPPPPPLTLIRKNIPDVPKQDDKETIEIIDDKDEQDKNTIVNGLDKNKSKLVIIVKNKEKESNKSSENNSAINGEIRTYNLKEPLSSAVIKMKKTTVLITRSPEIDELVRSKYKKGSAT